MKGAVMNGNQAAWYLPGPDNQPTGPYTIDQVLELCRKGKIERGTLCWQEGMDGWSPLSQVQQFYEILPDISPVADTAGTETQELDDLGKMFGKAVSLTKKKAKIVSLKRSIGKHEKRKHQILFELGNMLYEKEGDSEILGQSPYVEKIQQARAQEKSIQALRKEIEAIENSGQVHPETQDSQDQTG
jgi:hypothetical protein